jgi:sodium pump decarboxylase gamma subunit
MEKILYGLGVAALGMITVFAGLLILIAFIKILTAITTAGQGKKKTNTRKSPVKSAQNADVPDDVMAAITAAIAAYDGSAAPEVVAAIAAALNVVMGEGNFVVRHVKRISNAPRWNRAGREEQIYSRF